MISTSIESIEKTQLDPAPSKAPRQKRLIIGAALIGAAVLGGIGSIIWYYSDQKSVIGGVFGTSSRNAQVASKNEAVKTVTGVLGLFKSNLKVAVPLLALFVLSLVALVVIISLSLMEDPAIITDEDETNTTTTVSADESMFSPIEIAGLVVGSVLILIITLAIGRKLWTLMPSKPNTAHLDELRGYRGGVDEISRCKSTKINDDYVYKLQIKKDGQESDVYCPKNFSFNSVWWTFYDKQPASAVDQKNKTLVVFKKNYFRLKPAVGELSHQTAVEQACVLQNVPGYDGIPTEPLEIKDANYARNAFSEEYTKWLEESDKVDDCQVVQKRSENTAYCLFASSTGSVMSFFVECNKQHSLKGIHKALRTTSRFTNSRFILSETTPSEYSITLINPNDSLNEARVSVWKMYEPLKCKANEIIEEEDEGEAEDEVEH